jgi:hypothetical protein
MAAVSKENLQNSLIIHTVHIDYCGAKCYVFGIKEFLKMIIGCGKTK